MQEFVHTPSFFWIFWVVITLFGILLGWVLRTGFGGKSFTDDYQMRDQERLHLATLNNQLRELNDLKDADLKKSHLELDEFREQAATVEDERRRLLDRLQNAQNRRDVAERETTVLTERVQSCEEQILGLRTRNAYLQSDMGRQREEINSWKNLHMDFAATQQNAAALEHVVAELERERDLARHELAAALFQLENLEHEIFALQPPSANGHAPDEVLDDLKVINGITPFLEKKLHHAGVHRLEQLAALSPNDLEKLAEVLGVFPARIQREDWVGQAKWVVG